MDLKIAAIDAWIVALTTAVLMLAAWKIGTWIGQRARAKSAEEPSKFDDASIALLGLLLAFAFGISLSKYEQRRTVVVEDTNAIGDFYTCATLLKQPIRSKLQAVIRDYTELRLGLAQRQASYAEVELVLPQMKQAHEQMTELVAQAISDGTPIAVSLTNTLNELTSKHVARLAAVTDRLPVSVAALLVVSAVVSTMLVGREQGLSGKAEIAGTICFIFLVTLAIYVIFDLNQPERGLIRLSQEPMERLLSSMPK